MISLGKHIQFRGDIRQTTLISLLFHAFLFLVFMLFNVSSSIELPEFVEINFVRAGSAQPQQRITLPRETAPKQEEPAEAQTEKPLSTEKIELPKRKMLEEEPAALSVRKPEKKVTTGGRNPIPGQKPAPESKERFAPQTIAGERTKTIPGTISPDKLIPRSQPPGKTGFVQSFEIEGKATERKILSKVLPSYPKGYNHEGVIKIRFTILPNGLVGEMIPLLKTDAVLEQNTMNALSKWRFNPIPADAPQEIVEGIITFRYKLK